MKILFSWLKDYVDIDEAPEQLAQNLSMFAHEVESIQKIGDDAVLDLEITPNRGDCLSILGMARQIAAMNDQKIKNLPEQQAGQNEKVKIKEENIDQNINVQVTDPKICPRFTARIIDHVKITSSPAWMQKRLKSYGFRPINNIVDVTNYVMVATGQPLHAFDYDKISQGSMKIRLSKKGEEVKTLDGKIHQLSDNIIVIEDKEKIYDLAGIMGGADSEVDQNTKTIVLQGAIFDPVLIRRASKFLKHVTDASYRYERGVDYEGAIDGVNFATNLIKQILPAIKIGILVDIKSQSLPKTTIPYSDEKINQLLGTNLTTEEIKKSLERLYFKVDDHQATVPSFRLGEVNIWQDLAEEVARIYGINNLKRFSPTPSTSKQNPEWQKRVLIKNTLKNLGLTENYSYSFAEKDKIELTGEKIENCVEIVNPISPETQYLRPSLLPSLLSAVAKNPWAPEICIFEIEKVFSVHNEKWQLGIATVGKSDQLINKVAKAIGFKNEIINVDQKILDIYKIRRPVKACLIDLDEISSPKSKISDEFSVNKFRPISKYPPTIFDLAFIVDTKISSSAIKKSILGACSDVLLSENFDEFVSDRFGANKKNIAFHIWLQNMTGPVDENQTKQIRQKLIEVVEQKFKAKLRS